MKRKIVLSNDLKEKINSVNYNDECWQMNSINNSDDLLKLLINKLNEKYKKLEITEYEFNDDVSIDNESSTYFGLIINDHEEVDGYTFVIPPSYETRSGVLAQQVFPVLSGLMKNIDYKDNKICNKPIFILNINEVNLTPSIAVNIKSGEILNFKYIDIFERSLDEILEAKSMKKMVNNLVDYDLWLKQLQNNNINEFFELDLDNHIMYFLPNRIKDGIHVNNEPYWFVLKAYTAVYLALNEGYKIDMSKYDQTILRGNKTLDAFREYIERIS